MKTIRTIGILMVLILMTPAVYAGENVTFENYLKVFD
jgi:hypothetical protein